MRFTKHKKYLFTILIIILNFENISNTHSNSKIYKSRPKNVTYRLSFGSCFKHQIWNENSQALSSAANYKPDSWIWLGDVAYLDNIQAAGILGFQMNKLEEMKKRFDRSYEDVNYTKLRKSVKKIYGVWDDHDSGLNDGDKNVPFRDEIRKLFLKFLEEPKDSVRWTRKDGIYGSYYLDNAQQIKLILIDSRSSRDPPKNKFNLTDESELGEKQEEWLKQELKNSEAKFTIIGSGLPVIPDDRLFPFESTYPRTRKIILETHNPKTRFMILSGDVHYAEVFKTRCHEHIHGYQIPEFLSSGITHGIGDVGYISDLTIQSVNFLDPGSFNDRLNNYTKQERKYFGHNFGLIDFDLQNNRLVVTIHDQFGNVVIKKNFDDNYFTQKEIPDYKKFNQCIKDIGTPQQRFKNHIFKTLKNPFRRPIILFLIILLYLGFRILCFTWYIFSLVFKRLFRGQKNKNKLKTE